MGAFYFGKKGDAMDIKGMDMFQIGKKIETCLLEYFSGNTILDNGCGIFSEVIRLAYDEIDHLLIQSDNEQLFNGGEWFNGASGIIELSNTKSGLVQAYTVMLIMDEPQAKALYLYVSKWDAITQDDMDILVKDFTQGGDI